MNEQKIIGEIVLAGMKGNGSISQLDKDICRQTNYVLKDRLIGRKRHRN